MEIFKYVLNEDFIFVIYFYFYLIFSSFQNFYYLERGLLLVFKKSDLIQLGGNDSFGKKDKMSCYVTETFPSFGICKQNKNNYEKKISMRKSKNKIK